MITSVNNPAVKRIRRLASSAKDRNEEKCFLVEGPRMFSELPASLRENVYVSDTFLSGHPEEAGRLLKGVRYETVTGDVMRRMSDTGTPQGILAVARQKETPEEEIFRIPGAHLLFLERLQDPGNLGTILRAGEGAGVTGVIMSADSADVYSPKVVRSTMGAVFRVPFAVTGDILDSIRRAKEAGITVFAAHLRGTVNYEEADFTGPLAFLIGNEAAGLSPEAAGLADRMVKIPMAGQVESLNAAVAAAVLSFEAARQRRTLGKDPK